MHEITARLSLNRDASGPNRNGDIHLVLTHQVIDEPDVTVVLRDDGSDCYEALAQFIAEADAYRDRAIDGLHADDAS